MVVVAWSPSISKDTPLAHTGTIVAAAPKSRPKETPVRWVGTENLAGRKCDVWRLTDDRGRREVSVQQEPAKEMLPLRVEIYNRQAGAEIRTDYIQWATGLELPDRLFLPEASLTITKLGYDEYVKRASAGES